MTIDDVIGPIMLPTAIGIAVAAMIALFWHVARRYSTAPKRVPLGLRIDGRPRGLGAKQWLWVSPSVLLVFMALLCTIVVLQPPAEDARTTTALVFLILAEIAWFVGWTTDRQIELARGMTHRIPPARLLRVFFPIAATIVFALVHAIRPAS